MIDAGKITDALAILAIQRAWLYLRNEDTI
jgi:hypothetical protein